MPYAQPPGPPRGPHPRQQDRLDEGTPCACVVFRDRKVRGSDGLGKDILNLALQLVGCLRRDATITRTMKSRHPALLEQGGCTRAAWCTKPQRCSTQCYIAAVKSCHGSLGHEMTNALLEIACAPTTEAKSCGMHQSARIATRRVVARPFPILSTLLRRCQPSCTRHRVWEFNGIRGKYTHTAAIITTLHTSCILLSPQGKRIHSMIRATLGGSLTCNARQCIHKVRRLWRRHHESLAKWILRIRSSSWSALVHTNQMKMVLLATAAVISTHWRTQCCSLPTIPTHGGYVYHINAHIRMLTLNSCYSPAAASNNGGVKKLSKGQR